MQTATDLYRRADALEAQGHAAPDGSALAFWRHADRLRAQAQTLEAATIGWRLEVEARVHAAAGQALDDRWPACAECGITRAMAEAHAAAESVADPVCCVDDLEALAGPA